MHVNKENCTFIKIKKYVDFGITILTICLYKQRRKNEDINVPKINQIKMPFQIKE